MDKCFSRTLFERRGKVHVCRWFGKLVFFLSSFFLLSFLSDSLRYCDRSQSTLEMWHNKTRFPLLAFIGRGEGFPLSHSSNILVTVTTIVIILQS